jgi:hypothetical protein
MSFADTLRRSLRIAIATGLVGVIALLGCVASANAAGFGELPGTRFGKAGTGPGELTEWEIGPEQPATPGFGVDPDKESACGEGNCVFVLDEPQEDLEKSKELTRFFRLQKFKSTGGKYTVSASTEVPEISPLINNAASLPALEGVAVDAKTKRVYFLATDDRTEKASIDTKRTAASTLYEYSTEEKGTELVPEGKVVGGKATPILTGPAELETQSTTAGKALLEPRGITVDPYTNEVIILALEDSSPEHWVLQRIEADGALGKRYVDTTNFLKKGFYPTTKPDSPVVTGPESSPHVYVNFEGLAEIPYNFASSEAPKQIYQEPRNLEKRYEPFVGGVEESWGGALSVSPNGEDIYGEGTIWNEQDETYYPGVFERSAKTGALIGWTGGQSPSLSHEDECVLNPSAKTAPSLVAAAAEEKVFVLGTGYLGEEEEEEEGAEPPVPHPAIIELGPGGTGCPTASGEPLEAVAAGVTLKEKEEIPAERTITFSAHPLGADALKVTWLIENTRTHVQVKEVKETTPETGEYRKPKLAYKFTKPGPYLITAAISTDSFETPLLEKTFEEKPISFELTVKGSVEEPPAITSPAATTFTEGKAGSFTVKATGDPTPAVKESGTLPEGVTFNESTDALSGTPAHSGTYPIKFEAANGIAPNATQSFTLTIAPKEEEHNNTGTTTTETTTIVTNPTVTTPTTTSPTVTTPTGQVGVLSYQVSFGATKLTVSKTGALSIVVNCSGQSSCAGTMTLRTLKAVSSGHSKHKAILTLATGSFTVTGAHKKTVTLHLSKEGHEMLESSHTLKVRATIVARDSSGKSHTTVAVITLVLPHKG